MGIINVRDLNAKRLDFVFLNGPEERSHCNSYLLVFCNVLLQMGM